MEKEILIVKNITEEGPGLLEELLDERRIKYTVADLHQGERFPTVKNFAAVVVLGGPDSANDENEKMKNELERVGEILALKIPYLGICLGLQVLVKAAGGQVVKSPTKEVGFIAPDGHPFRVELTQSGITDALFYDMDNILEVFHLHGETVELTDCCILLASGQFCQNQVVRVNDNAYGIQCHFELTPEMFENWIHEDPDLLLLDKEILIQHFELVKDKYTEIGRQLLTNFLSIAGF